MDEHDRFFHTYFASKRQAEAKAQARRSKKHGKKDLGKASGGEGEEEDDVQVRYLIIPPMGRGG